MITNKKQATFLKKKRKEASMTQKDVAKKINVAERAYIYYEHGERKMPAKAFVEFCHMFNHESIVKRFLKWIKS